MTAAIHALPKPRPAFPEPSLVPVYRLSVDQYHRMIETGVLSDEDRVELLEGLLVPKMPHHPSHAGSVSVLVRELGKLLPDRWIVRVQSAITLATSEPEPDLAVVLGPEERYFAAHPKPVDIGLVVEVADSSLNFDRTQKSRIYARNKLPVYWIVNLVEQTVEVYSNPKAGKFPSYRSHECYRLEQDVPLMLAEQECGSVPVARFFPRS